MARKLLLLISALTLSLLALAGCTNNGSGDNSYSGDNEETSQAAETSGSESQSPDAAACNSFSPGSPEQASCEAQGVPGTTQNAERCGSTTPSPIASGIIQGTFGPYCDNAIATTYDTSLVPDGADTTVTITETDADTTLEMIARGFAVDTEFTATLHENLCGAEPSAAGQPYTDQESGLRLDFTTDDSGGSTASVTAPWTLPDDGIGRSLLITADTSATSPGKSNVDQSVACVSLER